MAKTSKSKEIKMTIGASIVLNKVLTMILFSDADPKNPVERNLPLSLKYKLQRAKSVVEKDCAYFDKEKNELIVKLGVEDVEKKQIYIPDDKMEEYRAELLKLLQIEVSHSFMKIKPESIADIDVEGISTEEISVLMAVLIEDEDLVEDLKTPIEKPEEATSETPATK